jgi:hypothetical protein
MIKICFNGLNEFKQYYSSLFIINGIFTETINNLGFTNIQVSSKAIDFESVDEIRENAPNAHKMGNRLITADDYRTYILNKYKSRVTDIYVSNNFEYTTVFYKWLKDYDKLNIDIRKNNYMFADACDFNNVYLWLLPNSGNALTAADKTNIINDCNKIKGMTCELVPCDVLRTYFVPFIKHPDLPLSLENLSYNWTSPCKIIIIKKANNLISESQLKTQINSIFVEYFSLKNQKLGNTINIDEIEQKIYDLPSVEAIKTRYSPMEKYLDYPYFEKNGLSMASFTQQLIYAGDFDVFAHSKKLLQFQFAALYKNSVEDLIEIEYIN